MDESALKRYFDKYIANDNWRTEQEEVTEEKQEEVTEEKQEEVTEEKQEEVTEEKQEELTEGEELFSNLLPDELLSMFPSDNTAESRTADNLRTEQEEVTEEKQEEVTEEKQEELTEEEELFLKLLPDELLTLFTSDNTEKSSRTLDNNSQNSSAGAEFAEASSSSQPEASAVNPMTLAVPEILRLPKPTPVICNVFSTVNLGCRLDLHSIARNMWNVEYNPKSFKGLIMRNQDPKATVIMFASGKMTCFVRESIMMARLMARRFARKLQKFGFPVQFLNFKIQNLVATCKAFPVDLNTLCKICKWEYSYDPLKFSGLFCKVNPRIKVTVFSTGHINLTGGVCNISMDPECRDVILQSDGISLVTNCLSSQREETVLSAITTLMNLLTPASRFQITDPTILQCMLRFSLSESPRMCNLAAVFLQDCCTEDQVVQAQRQMEGQQTAVGIPLPRD